MKINKTNNGSKLEINQAINKANDYDDHENISIFAKKKLINSLVKNLINTKEMDMKRDQKR